MLVMLPSSILVSSLFFMVPAITLLLKILFFVIVIFSTLSTALCEEIRVAVRANQGIELAISKWQATFDRINKSIPEHHFVLVPFASNSELNQAISYQHFSFSLTNPAAAVEHKIRYGYQPLATLINKRHGKGYTKFGSVIFTRADRSDLNTIKDLKNKIFIGADELGFGGWRVAWREMLLHGIDPYTDFAELRFAGGKQQRVVRQVIDGDADAGSVRTDLLERMAAEGQLDFDLIKVLGARKTKGFLFIHSTELYPEWLFSATKLPSNDLKNRVTIALLSISKNDIAAKKGKYVGWSNPHDYDSVEALLRDLKVGPFHSTSKGMLSEVIQKYIYVITAVALLIVGLIFAFIYMTKLNRRISSTQAALQVEMLTRERAEHVLTSLAQQSLEFSKEESFFKECLINLAHLFTAKYTFIGLFANPEKTRIKTYAVWAGDQFVDNFEYALEGTPCQEVLDLKVELIGEHATERYPDDKLLADMKIDSYFGAPLVSPGGMMMGLISVMDTGPMNPDMGIRPILKIFANRIALEIQRKREEEKLQGMAKQLTFQASHDSLTGLINRREFENKMKAAWDLAMDHDEVHALCYMDLDQFKVVNDTSGHCAGDELLKQLSVKLASQIRGSDTLARLGGDEFGVLLMECPIERAEEIAKKLLEVVRAYRFGWQNNVFEIGVSIGVVPINKNSRDINELLQAADSACYVAKDLGRNRIHIYKEDDIEVSARKGEMRWVAEINRALRENDFILLRQPIQALNSEITPRDHYEFLLRMTDENGEELLPGSFISAAERYNLMHLLDEWVIENSFKFLHDHYSKKQRYNSKDILYAINLSGLSISSETLPAYIEKMLAKYDISPLVVCFEITETAAITNYTQAVNFIERMKHHGFCFALDDFGTGVCSYAYLKSLPVNYLKIDGQFVSGLLDDPLNKAIIESIVHVAKVMKIQTIAEWVENEAIRNELERLGVNYIQGNYIGYPEALPTQQLVNALAAN